MNMHFEQMSLGSRLAWLMQEKQMSQVALAKACGITQAAISNIKVDDTRRPSAGTLLAMADALGCNPDFILTGKGDPWKWAAVKGDAAVELMTVFNAMPADKQRALLLVAKSMA